MKRPPLLRILPERLRMSAWWRLYRHAGARWAPLYASAPLDYAPGVRMELVPGDVISDSIAFTGVYESPLSRRVAELAKSGGTMIDVGANLGYVTLLWAAARPDNRCISFEASPRNIALLRRNVARNGVESRVQVMPVAAGRRAEKLRFHPGHAHQTGGGGLLLDSAPGEIEVDVVRIDEVVPADTRIALLKVDIEGADAWALMGCERLLASRLVDEVWFEQNKPRMEALRIPVDAAQDYLRSVGYVSRPLGDPDAPLVEWRATPAARSV